MASPGLLVRDALEHRPLLPFQRIPDELIVAAEDGLREAWNELVKEQKEFGVKLDNDREEIISYQLVIILNVLRSQRCEPPSALAEFFESVRVGSGYMDYRKQRIKQPDFAFIPRDNPYPGLDETYYGIFVEAKILEQGSKKQTGEYFRKGVIRFLDGRYAWAMPHGLMLAYVRTDQILPEAITKYLVGHGRSDEFGVTHPIAAAKPPNPVPKIWVTMHRRNWDYIDRPGAPGDIEIRHLWLSIYA